MRVKHDHPSTTEFSQQGQQSPTSNISEELESRFNNALKPMPSEAEHGQETTRLYKAALSLDKFEPLKPKAQPDHLQQEKPKTKLLLKNRTKLAVQTVLTVQTVRNMLLKPIFLR